MLRRENIGGFWQIERKPLPPPPPRIYTRIRNVGPTSFSSLTSPSVPDQSAHSSRNRVIQLRSYPPPSGCRLAIQDGVRDGLEATLARENHPTDFTGNETSYALSYVLINDILGRILAYNYDNDPQSSTTTTSDGEHQATVSRGITDAPTQIANTSLLQDDVIVRILDFDALDAADDSGSRDVSASDEKNPSSETLPYDQSLETMNGSLNDLSGDHINSTVTSSSKNDHNGDNDGDNGSDGHSGSSGSLNHFTHHPNDSPDTPKRKLTSHIFSPALVKNPRPEIAQSGSHREVREEGGALGEALQAPSVLQEVPTTLAHESTLIPTKLHHQMFKHFEITELVAPINEFLRQNAARFDDFVARRQACIPMTIASQRTNLGSPIKTTFSHSWDNKAELDLLTQAILWLDNLLAPFRAAVTREDMTSLKPRIGQAVRQLEETGVPAKLITAEYLTIAEKEIVRHFTDSVVSIQGSNSMRRQLLGHVNIDILLFENLLSSAENIRYRRDLGRECGQTDDLVDGLRRIYSTVTCTIPVGLSEQDSIEQSAQPHRITYKNDMYYPYKLSNRPEIFDHPSLSLTALSSTGATGILATEQQNSMRQGYYQELLSEMMGTIAAQKMDEVGTVKIAKRPDSMNRDWGAFYKPIYGSGMANYAQAGALRIETEEYLQDHSRRSSTNCSDTSSATIELELGDQKNAPKKRSNLCLSVNKPEGCPDWNSCGAKSHANANRECKNGLECKFGPERCAYRHSVPSGSFQAKANPGQQKKSSGLEKSGNGAKGPSLTANSGS